MTYAIDSIGMYPGYTPNISFTGAPAVTTGNNSPKSEPSDSVITPDIPKSESHGIGKAVLCGVLGIGAACLCRKAYKVGEGATFFEKTANGFGKGWKSIKSWFTGKKTPTTAATTEHFTVTEVNGKQVCTVPGKRNILRGEGLEERLAQIGCDAKVPELYDETGKLVKGIKIREGKITKGDYSFIIRNGKIVKCEKNGVLMTCEVDGKTVRDLESAYKDGIDKKEIEEALAKLNKGEKVDGITITSFSDTKDGVSRLFRAGESGEYELSGAVSRNFNLDADAVQALCYDNPKVKDAVNALKKGKSDGLTVASAEFSNPKKPELGTLFIKNGEIDAIKIGDTVYPKDSDKWKSLMLTNHDAYKKILEKQKKWTNIVYQLA